MNKGINLLGERKQTSLSPLLRRLELFRLIAIGLLFVVSSASVVLFLLIFLSPLPSLQEKEKEALSAMSEYHPDVARLQLISDRLSTSSTIIEKRSSFDQNLKMIREVMPFGLSVSSLVMKEKRVMIAVSSSSLSSLDEFMQNLINASDQEKKFAKVSLVNLATDERRRLFILTLSITTL